MKLRLVLRIVLVFMLLAVVLLATVGTFSYRSARENLKAAIISEMLSISIEKEVALDAWIQERLDDHGQLGADVDLAQRTANLIAAAPVSEKARSAYGSLLEDLEPYVSGPRSGLIELFVIEPKNGKVVASTFRTEEGKSKIGRPYFDNGKFGLYLQGPYHSIELNAPAMTVAIPLRSTDGQMLAVLAARLDLASMNAIVQRGTELRRTEDTFLINAEQLLVTQPRFISEPAVLRRKIDTEDARHCITRNNGVILAPDYRAVPVISVCRWMDKYQLGLIVKIDQDEAFAPVRAFGQSVVRMSGLALLATAGLAFLLARTITRPLRALHDSVKRLADGKTDQPLPESSKDELSLLAGEFNRMETRVQRRTSELAETNITLQAENTERKRLETNVAERTKDLEESRIAAMNMMEDAVEAKAKTEQVYKELLQEGNVRKQAEATIQGMAFYDTLTGLPNRNMLYDRLLNAVQIDCGQGKPMAILLMDLDHFKEINDTLGHHRGDLLLKEVGVRLKSVLFEPDVVARLGGDEFAILLPKLASPEDIKLVIQKIITALEAPFMIEGVPIAVEASIGVALYPDHGENPDSLMQRADVAMYKAKETGNGYMIYDIKFDQHSPRRLALIGELRQAIEKDQLFLHYQPKISLKTNHIIGVEALVRWQHPEYGFVPPDQFILPAEQTGLIHPLTRWVLKTALNQSQAWRQAGLNLPVAVNLSARNLHDPQFPEHLAELLKTTGALPEQLELEITESAIMADPARAFEVITRLRTMGLRFALDDFGIGYSSLAYLKKLPVDAIKIDKSFVIDMAKDEDDVVIVLSTISLAHNLGLKVVAEGVETEMILNQLSAFGCDEAQGYYMSKPLPVDALDRWLKESPWGMK